MRRRVWFDTTSRAAAAAAPLLGEQFDVAALPPAAVPPPGADGTGRPPADAGQLRVLGLVDAQAPGPWPERWHALLPAGVGRPILTRTVLNAFGDLDAVTAVARLDRE